MGHIDDRYERDKRAVLGGGTYATVYAARCKRTGEQVALKKLRRMAAPAAALTARPPYRGGGGDGPAGLLGIGMGVAAGAAAAPPLEHNGDPLPFPFAFHAGEATAHANGGGGGGGGGCLIAGGLSNGGAMGAGGGALTDWGRGGSGADDRGGVGLSALREIKVLQELRHLHIIRLRETVPHKETLVLVFDFAAGGDLELLLYPAANAPGGGAKRGGAAGGPGGRGAAAAAVTADTGNGEGEPAEPPLPAGVVKAHMKALLEALAYCHEQGVLHRDVKPNNLLLDGQGRLLLADFGLARYLPLEAASEEPDDHPAPPPPPAPLPLPLGTGAGDVAASAQTQHGSSGQGTERQGECRQARTNGGSACRCSGGTGCRAAQGLSMGEAGSRPAGEPAGCEADPERGVHAQPVMTHQVGMRWYRPPELLFGSRTYGTAVDIWAAGCVFAEMMLRRVWFKGNSDVDQLRIIFEVLGTPSEETWPGVTRLPNYLKFATTAPQDLALVFPDAAPHALDLLAQLVQLCPDKRPTARQALSHPYFTSDPPPTPPGQLPLALTRVAAARSGGAAGAGTTAADDDGDAAFAAFTAAVAWDHNGWGVFGGGRRAAAAAASVGIAGRGGPSGGRHGGGCRREGGLPMFRAPRSQGALAMPGEGSLPRFQLPLPPSLPPGRLPAGRLSFESGAGAGAGCAGWGSSVGAGGLAGGQHAFGHANGTSRLRGPRPSLDFPDLAAAAVGPALGPLPPPGSSAAGDVAAAVAAAAAGGGSDVSSVPGLPYHPPAFFWQPRPWGPAVLGGEDGGGCSGAAEVAARVSSTAVPYDGAPPQGPRWPPLHGASVAPGMEAAASAPRVYRRVRRTRSSVATADMSVSEMSVGAVGMVGGGRLCFDEALQEAADGAEGGDAPDGRFDGGYEDAEALDGDGGGGGGEHDGEAYAEDEGLLEEDVEEIVEEDEDEDFGDEDDGFRRCVARRFSFGSSLVTEGNGAAATAAAAAATAADLVAADATGSAAAAAAAAAAELAATGSGGAMAATGGAGGQRDSDAGAGGGGGVAPMVTTTATTAAGGGATTADGGGGGGYDPMCISVSICGGGGGGGGGGFGTVGSKRPRPLRECFNRQSQPPTPGAATAALAIAEGAAKTKHWSSAHAHLHQAHLVGGVGGGDGCGAGGGSGGGERSGGLEIHMRGGSAGSGASIDFGGGGRDAAAAAVVVAAAPSVTMVSVCAAPSASVNAAMVHEGNGTAAIAAPPPATAAAAAAAPAAAGAAPARGSRRPLHGRASDVTVAMSLSFAGGLDVNATHAALSRAAPPTVVGPMMSRGVVVAEQPSVRGPQATAVGSGGGDGTSAAGADAAAIAATTGAAPLPGLPLLPPLVPRMPSLSADVITVAGAADGGDGSGGLVTAAAPAALSGSVHLRPGPSGLRPASPDLQYLRQRKAEVDRALRQASQADDPPDAGDEQEQPQPQECRTPSDAADGELPPAQPSELRGADTGAMEH